MSIKEDNRKAWEQAYAQKNDYEAALLKRIADHRLFYVDEPMKSVLDTMDLNDKTVAQFCMNNGRELLSVCHAKGARGLGFDIAENMVEAALEHARALKLDVECHAVDIDDMSAAFADRADLLITTVGALCWFETLDAFFSKAALVLKEGGTLLIQEMHPFASMLASEDEVDYDSACPQKPVYDYFERKQWTTHDMGYMSDITEAVSFHSFSHTLSDIVNALCRAGFIIEEMVETPLDHGNMFEAINGGGLPLTMMLRAVLPDKR